MSRAWNINYCCNFKKYRVIGQNDDWVLSHFNDDPILMEMSRQAIVQADILHWNWLLKAIKPKISLTYVTKFSQSSLVKKPMQESFLNILTCWRKKPTEFRVIIVSKLQCNWTNYRRNSGFILLIVKFFFIKVLVWFWRGAAMPF